MSNEIMAFRKGLRRIDESGLNRIMWHGKHGFIIISANRTEIYSNNPNNDLTPQYEEWCKKEDRDILDKSNMDFWLRKRNKTEDAKLLKKLKDSKYSYTPVYGGYKGSDGVSDNFEPSYIVYAHTKGDSNTPLDFDKLYKFGIELVREFHQDSVYVQKPNEAPIYVDANGNQVNSTSSKDMKFNRDTEEFFTTKNRKKRTTQDYQDQNGDYRYESSPQRFTADIQFESLYRKASPSTLFEREKRRKLGEVFIDE